jgi:hypothetical protein
LLANVTFSKEHEPGQRDRPTRRGNCL